MRCALLLAALALAAVVGIADGGSARVTNPRVGFVAYPGATPTTRTLDGLAFTGFVRAQQRLAIRGRVQYLSPTQGPGNVMRSFSRQGYDLVIAPDRKSTRLNSSHLGISYAVFCLKKKKKKKKKHKVEERQTTR